MNTLEGFKETPKPRELTTEEYYSLFHPNLSQTDYIHTPTFELTDVVWAAANNGKLPVYRFYYTGTNSLTILRYTWEGDIWEKIKLEEIENLYGLLWKLISYFSSNEIKYSEWES